MEEQADRVRLIALFQQMETGCRSGDVGCEAGASAGKAYTLKPQYGFIYVIEAPWGRAANGRAPPPITDAVCGSEHGQGSPAVTHRKLQMELAAMRHL